MKKFTLLIASLFITIGAMAQFDANKYYTVVAEGHTNVSSPAWAVNDAGDAFVSTGNITIANDAQKHFAFVEFNGATYLYSVSAKKFVKNNATLVAALGDAVTIEALSNGKYFFKFSDTQVINIGGEGQMTIDTWGGTTGSKDGGNQVTVTEAGDFTVEDLAEAINIIYTPSSTGAKTRTNRMVGSITVGSGTYTMPTGTDATRNSYTNLTATQTFTVQPGATVNLAMTQTEGSWMNAFVYVDTDNNGFTAGVEADGYTPTGDLVSFSFYSNSTTSDESGKNSAGASITGDDRSTLTLPSWTVPEDLEPGEYRIRFKYDWNNIDPAGGQGTYFGNTFTGHGGEIIDATLQVVEPYTITYNYKQGDVLICSISHKVAHGAEYPALVSGLYGVTVNGTKPDGTVTRDEAIDIAVTLGVFPFEYADSYENVDTWYYAVINSTGHDVETGALGDGKYMRAGTSDIPADTQTFGLSDVDAYSWGFVGDPINGFKMVSKGGKAIKTNNQASTAAELVDIAQGTVFTVKNPGNAVDNRPDAFCLLNTSNYLNLQSGYVKQWTSADGGSTILLTQRNFDVTISTLGYATLFLDRKVYIPEGVEAYVVKSDNALEKDGYIQFTQVTGILPENTGVVLKNENAGTYEFTTSIENATADVANNMLTGTVVDAEIAKEAGNSYYILANVDNVVGFYGAKYGEDETKFKNYANKAYLVIPAAQGTAAFYGFDWGGTTGIDEITDNREQSTVIYDLTGRRVETITEPGIYIVGGKKVLVK